MAILKTDAIILKTQPFRSSSLIVTLFSKDYGKIKGVAKGVRLERELRGALFELFTQVEIVYYEKQKSDLHLISETFILESYEPIRSRMESIATASYFSDLVDQLTEFHDPHEPIYKLLQFGFRYLASLPHEKISRIFESRLIKEIGWLPYLGGCVQCKAAPSAQMFFSPIQGALYCSQCASAVRDARLISEETLTALRYYLEHDPEESVRLSISSQTSQGLANLMNQFFEMRLHRPLKSKIFYEKIKSALKN